MMFTEQASGFSTSDLRDAQEQIVQFNTANELIWTADGTHLPGYRAQGNFIPAEASCGFVVRFGTRNGETSLPDRRLGTTDKNGFYEIHGLAAASRESSAMKDGYEPSGVVASQRRHAIRRNSFGALMRTAPTVNAHSRLELLEPVQDDTDLIF